MQYINGRGWREEITPALKDMGIVVFDPYHKPFENGHEDEITRTKWNGWMQEGQYDLVAEQMKIVRNQDLRLCDVSDFIVAHINPSVASWGSAEEIVTSVRAKKPVFISVEGGKSKIPFWLLGMMPSKYFYNSPQEIVEMLQKIDRREKDIDSDRWRLLKEEFR